MKKSATLSKTPTFEERIQSLFDLHEKIAEQLGGISKSQGDATEEFFVNSLMDKKNIGGIRFDEVLTQVKGGEPGRQQEYDIILKNGNVATVIEVKYRFREQDLKQLDQQIQRIKKDFRSFRKMDIYGGIAGFSIPAEVASAAHKKGYFVLRRKGGLLRVDTADMKPAQMH
jgi:hypothetical protein